MVCKILSCMWYFGPQASGCSEVPFPNSSKYKYVEDSGLLYGKLLWRLSVSTPDFGAWTLMLLTVFLYYAATEFQGRHSRPELGERRRKTPEYALLYDLREPLFVE